MATVEGNLEALMQAANELIPPVRSGQNASKSQDDVGPPFITKNVTLSNVYQPNNPNAVAPSWVYGLCVDSVSGSATDTVWVAFGGASSSAETKALPGQVIMFPRGARRVFIRGSSNNLPVTVTWFLDRFADKRYAPKTDVAGQLNAYIVNDPLNVALTNTANVAVTNSPNIGTVTNPLGAVVNGQVESATGEGAAELDTGTIQIGGRKFWGFAIVNWGTEAATWELRIKSIELVLDSGTVPAAAGGAPGIRFLTYGPGCSGTMPTNWKAAALNLPEVQTGLHLVKLAGGGEGTSGEKSGIFWWGRY